MAHFVKIVNGIVTNGIVVSNNDCGGGDFPASEPIGQAFIASLNIEGEWRQTSYNNNFRGVYASGGFTFDADADEFRSPQPYPSWTWANNIWNAPTPNPTDGKLYLWNETDLDWVEV